MGTKQRREKDREVMRRRILDAAKLLFVKQGFDNVSMRGIAAAIEYSPAALYRYFRNKREILSVLRDEGFQRFVQAQQERLDTIPDPLERLRRGGRGYLRFALKEPEYFHLMFSTSCREVDMEGDCAGHSMKSYEIFYRNVQECVERGDFGPVAVDTVVFALWSSMHGLAHMINSGRVGVLASTMDVDRLIDDILDFNLRPGIR